MKIEQLEPVAGANNELNAPPTAPAAAPAKDKGFWVLNWLRFLLAAYLVFFHTLRNKYAVINDTWFEASLGLGNMATSLFFVLSGFLLTHSYVIRKHGRPIDRRGFLVARLSALYPLHIVALVVVLVPMMFTISAKGGISVPIELSGPPVRMLEHGEFLFALATNILLLNAWNPYYLSFNSPSWSLSALAVYYLMFPLLAGKIYRMARPGLGLVFLGALFLAPGAVADLLDRSDVLTDGLLHRNPIIRMPLFVAGMVLCVLFARSAKTVTRTQVLLLGGVIAATVIVGVQLQFQHSHMHMIRNGLYFPACLALIWLCVCVKSTGGEALRYWGQRLGAASLPMFLLHGPLFMIFVKVEQVAKAVALGAVSGNLHSVAATARQIEPSLAFYGVYFVALVGLCVVTQERFVVPVQTRLKNALADRKVAAELRKNALTGTD